MLFMNGPQQDLATQFRRHFSTPREERTPEEIETIFVHLKGIKAVYQLPEHEIHDIVKTARYEVHQSTKTIYQAEDTAKCWYILLSGSVYLEGHISYPGESFGLVTNNGRRISDCLILEQSEMIVIDYPQGSLHGPYGRRPQNNLVDEQPPYDRENGPTSNEQLPKPIAEFKNIIKGNEKYLDQFGQGKDNNRTGSEKMRGKRNSIEGINMSGMPESTVDTLDSEDEEDELLPDESAVVRDIVRDCLEKEPTERSEFDIQILMDFMQHLPAFNNLSHNIKVEMCKVMVFAVVENASNIVMKDGEEMDSWSVILNGSVDIIVKNEPTVSLHLGDSFGVKTEQETMYHKGTMITRVDDCQFVCIAQDDYWRIFSQGEASCRKVEEEGEVVMVTEHRVIDGGSRQGQVVIKGTPERLLDHLMEDHSVIDPTYVEDFLLTFVVFFNKSHDIATKLLRWFERPQLKDKVTRVMLLWVNNHYADFEGDTFMENHMQRFEYLLDAKKMVGQLRLLNMACSAKSKPRIITLQRCSKDAILEFSICGGKDRGFPIFVAKVDYDSRASQLGLKRGDQIMEVNGQSFENITGQKAVDILMSYTHLSIIVKTNTIGFKEVSQPSIRKTTSNPSLNENALASQYGMLNPFGHKKGTSVTRSTSDANHKEKNNTHRQSMDDQLSRNSQDLSALSALSGSSTLPRNIRKVIMKMKPFPKSSSEKEINKIDMDNENGQPVTRHVFSKPTSEKVNHNNPAIGQIQNYTEDPLDLNSQVIKVYRGDHTSRFFVLTKDTVAREVVATAIDAFGITDYSSKSYSLVQVTVTEDGLIRQTRLSDHANNLANRISLNARYYIKSSISEGPLSDEVAIEISRESNLTLLQLSPLEIAKELTLQDFELFRNVDSREYIYNLFEDKNERKSKNLRCVEQTTNTEMFWVISEICSEHNITKRVKLLKYFIKVAKFCKGFKNFNSMYAIISGLENRAVSRLKATWERLPQKYDKILEELKELTDPSRNMSKYRNLFTGERGYPPLIPWFPIVKKDMTFLHLGNDTMVEGLVNFEKLRMIAKEVRRVCKFCAIGYDPYKMDSMQDDPAGSLNVAQSVVSITPNSSGRRSGRSGSLAMKDPKKAYEEFQTSRRIRQYLEKLSVKHYSEKELDEMSNNCEPPASATLNNTARQKKPASPLPSNDKKKEDRLSIKSNTDSVQSFNISTASAGSRLSGTLLQKLESETKPQDTQRRRPAAPMQWSTESSSSSSRNGSLRSLNSTGSRGPPPYNDPSDFDDDEHGQVSMV